MQVYDISIGLSPDLPVWPGDQPIKIERVIHKDHPEGFNVSRIEASVHCGTHVDAPAHFFNGEGTVDQLSLKTLTGRAYVLHLPNADTITAALLEKSALPPRTRRVLFKTRNSKLMAEIDHKFNLDFVALDQSGAEWLVRKRVQLVGMDYFSVAKFDDQAEVHSALLSAGVVLVEGLDLSKVRQGRYSLVCLPMKIMGCDGAPARAILIGV